MIGAGWDYYKFPAWLTLQDLPWNPCQNSDSTMLLICCWLMRFASYSVVDVVWWIVASVDVLKPCESASRLFSAKNMEEGLLHVKSSELEGGWNGSTHRRYVPLNVCSHNRAKGVWRNHGRLHLYRNNFSSRARPVSLSEILSKLSHKRYWVRQLPLLLANWISDCINRCIHYLKGKQRADGSWEGLWGICFTYGTWFGIEGLIAAGGHYISIANFNSTV